MAELATLGELLIDHTKLNIRSKLQQDHNYQRNFTWQQESTAIKPPCFLRDYVKFTSPNCLTADSLRRSLIHEDSSVDGSLIMQMSYSSDKVQQPPFRAEADIC